MYVKLNCIAALLNVAILSLDMMLVFLVQNLCGFAKSVVYCVMVCAKTELLCPLETMYSNKRS